MVTLRELTESDLDSLVTWRNDIEVSRFLSDRLRSIEDATSWYRRISKTSGVWLKAILYDGRLVGYAAVESIDLQNRKCELAIVIGDPEVWGHGLGRTALEAMLQYAFESLGMHRVWAVFGRGNTRSEGLLKSAGFNQEGTLREAILIGGRFTDLLSFSILEDEYTSRPQ